jgi:pyridoxal phosphate-dependent aminotransferase EpsN
MFRLPLSKHQFCASDIAAVEDLMRGDWLSQAGLEVLSFEAEFADKLCLNRGIAVISGSAALHLALKLVDTKPGDLILCSTFTFAAAAFAIRLCGACVSFVDCEESSWNIDPDVLEHAILEVIRERGFPPKAVVAADCYGQSPAMDKIVEICRRYGIFVIEDCAESLGSKYQSRELGWASNGRLADIAVFSFNYNKIITCGGGGMLVARDQSLIEKGLYLANQAKGFAPYYQHSDIGFNYRLSCFLAAIGRSQLKHLANRVEARRSVFNRYVEGLADLPGVGFMPEPHWSLCNRWLSCITIDYAVCGVRPERILQSLLTCGIEVRSTWKPLHQQPVFAGCRFFGREVSDKLFKEGLCLPSGSDMTEEEQFDVVKRVRDEVLSGVNRFID